MKTLRRSFPAVAWLMLLALPLAFAGGIGGAGGGTADLSSVTGTLSAANGGTGVANNAAATLTRSGNHALTITTTGTTGVTLPTSGTLLASGGALGTPSSGTLTSCTGLPINTGLTIASQAQGDVLYYNGSAWTRLGAGTSGQFLKTQGAAANPIWADVSASGDGLTLTSTKTAAYTAVAGDHVLCDANAAAGNFAVTLPASPSNGDRVRVSLITDHATRKVTIADNGTTIMGGGSNDVYYTLLLAGDTVEFKYVGGTAGWAVTFDGIQPQVCTICSNTAQTGLAVNTVNAITLGTSVIDRGGIAVTGSSAITLRRAVRSATIQGHHSITGFSVTPVVNAGSYGWINVNGTRTVDGVTQSTSAGSIPYAQTTASFASGDSFTMSSYAAAVSGTYATADNTYGGRSELSFVEHR